MKNILKWHDMKLNERLYNVRLIGNTFKKMKIWGRGVASKGIFVFKWVVEGRWSIKLVYCMTSTSLNFGHGVVGH